MPKVLLALTSAASLAALVISLLALREARADETPTVGEIAAAAVRQFTKDGNRTTPEQAALLFGRPTEVYRDNPRALCWRYETPYEMQMCWGPKRARAWIAVTGLRLDRLDN